MGNNPIKSLSKQIMKYSSNETNIKGQKWKKINLKKERNKSDSNKPILVVGAMSQGRPNFSEHKKEKHCDSRVSKEVK
jgi:hypothetical protein